MLQLAWRKHDIVRILNLLPSRSEERGVLGVGGIPVALLQYCQDIKTIASYLHNNIRNTEEAV